MLIDNSNLSWVAYKKLNPEFQLLEDAGLELFGDIEDAPQTSYSNISPAYTDRPEWGIKFSADNFTIHFCEYTASQKLLINLLAEVTKVPQEELVKYLPKGDVSTLSSIDTAVSYFIKQRLGAL